MRHIANEVRGTRTRMDPGTKVERGRKERVACISHVVTHTWNAVCKCVQSDGSILQPVVPALVPLSFAFIPVLLSSSHLAPPPTSRGLERAHKRTRTRAHARSVLRRRLPGRATTSTISSRFRTCNDRSIAVGPSVPRHYFARGAGKRGKSCLRRMNKILFSPQKRLHHRIAEY